MPRTKSLSPAQDRPREASSAPHCGNDRVPLLDQKPGTLVGTKLPDRSSSSGTGTDRRAFHFFATIDGPAGSTRTVDRSQGDIINIGVLTFIPKKKNELWSGRFACARSRCNAHRRLAFVNLIVPPH